HSEQRDRHAVPARRSSEHKGTDLTNCNSGAAAQRGTLAVWLIRALGLEAEAAASAGQALPFADAAGIAADIRGYVYVANQRGLRSEEHTSELQSREKVVCR